MAIIHFAQREVEAKIVYWGPALSGKTTNLRFLHTVTPDQQKGELHALNTSDERTLFFDYLPLQMGSVAGFHARFKVFSVPGQIFYKETRRMVLKGADALVFGVCGALMSGVMCSAAIAGLEEDIVAFSGTRKSTGTRRVPWWSSW